MKIWIVGAEGMLGSALMQRCLREELDVEGTSRRDADVTKFERLTAKAEQIKPTHVINCAAYTDVDRAEKEPDAAFAVNAQGAENVALAARAAGARLVHISTDYVFHGTGTEPYREEDLCAPANEYGKSKWEGEKKVAAALPEACILRTSWLFGSKGKNLISSLMNWFQQKEELQVVFDQRGRPTYCHDLASAAIALLNASGVFHFANDGERSRYQIAIDLLQAAKERGIELRCQRIVPVPSAKFPTPAARPSYSVLDTSKFFHFTNIRPRLWGEVLNDYLHTYASSS
jgi:dTDP-4-dehydrorhamnose reductase